MMPSAIPETPFIVHYPLSPSSPRVKTCTLCGKPYVEGRKRNHKRKTSLCRTCVFKTNGQKSKGRKRRTPNELYLNNLLNRHGSGAHLA